MKKTGYFIIVALFFVGIAGVLPVHADTIWATEVTWFAGDGAGTEGTQRYTPSDALGTPEPGEQYNFLSLGLGGVAIFEFGQLFDTEATVVETTWGNRSGYVETADVYIAGPGNLPSFADAADVLGSGFFDFAGSIDNADATSTVDLSGLDGPFQYLMVHDTTQRSGDGFDIDAVGVAPVPEPGTVILLGLGLIGLAGARRKMKK